MLNLSRRFALKTALRTILPLTNTYRFSTYQQMKDSLTKNLYSIELINKQVSRRILAMAYSPGVGAVCEAVEQDAANADTMTLRSRAVAVVTDGSFLNASPSGVGPALDWIIAQIKYHSDLDAFPFIVGKDIDWEMTLKDLANSYGTVLDLDGRTFQSIPSDILVLNHQDVIAETKSEVTCAEKTSNVLAYLLKHNKKGLAKK